MADNTAVLVKVDPETKERMRAKGLNWSAEIRRFIAERLNSGDDMTLAKAVAVTDRLFRKAEGFESTAFIRKARDERHGPNRN